MGFSCRSLFGCLFYIFLPFSLQSFCVGRSVANLVSKNEVMIIGFWFAFSGSRFSKGNSLVICRDKKRFHF